MANMQEEKDIPDESENPLPTSSENLSLEVFMINAFIAYTGRCVLGVLNPFLPQTKLNQLLIGLLAAAIILTTCFVQIPMARKISKNGGKNEVLAIILLTLAGMLSLTTLAAVTDITAIEGFGLPYAVLLISACLIGLGSGSFPLLVNLIKFASSPSQIPTLQSIYSAVVDSSSVTTPIIIQELSHHIGYAAAFGSFACLIAIGGVVAKQCIRPAPYDQFKLTCSKERARELARAAGQLEITMQDEDELSTFDFIKANLKLLTDIRIFVLCFAMFVILGCFLVTETVLPTLLKSGYDIDEKTAVYVSAFANLITIASRPVAGKIISAADNESASIYVFLAGCALIIGSAIPLTFSNLPEWVIYTCIAFINVGFAFGIIPPLNITSISWLKPKNEDFKPYNPDIVFGLLGATGTFGGFILPLASGLLVDAEGKAGYQHYFFIIIAMILAAAIAVPIVDYRVRHTKEECKKIFDKPMTLFGRIFCLNKNKQNNVTEVEMEKEPLRAENKLSV